MGLELQHISIQRDSARLVVVCEEHDWVKVQPITAYMQVRFLLTDMSCAV